MKLTRKQISSFALKRVLQIFLTNFVICLQAASFGESEKLKLAQEEFGNKTLTRDERNVQASRSSLSALEDTGDDNNNKYYYIGGAVLAVILILLIIVICCCCSRSKKKKKRKKENQKSELEKTGSTEPPVNIFEPVELDVDANLQSSLPQAQTRTSISVVEIHQSNDNDYSNQQNSPQSPQGYSKEPQGHATHHNVAHQKAYYENEFELDQQKGYTAPFQVSDEGMQKPLPKGKQDVQPKRDMYGREFYGRSYNEPATIDEDEENYRAISPVYPITRDSSHRKNYNIQDDRVFQDKYDSVERKMNPAPVVAPKPSTNKKLSYRETEYMVKVLPDEEYRRRNSDKTYSYSVHEKRVKDKMDKFPDSRVQKGKDRPQSLYSDNPKYNQNYNIRQPGSFTQNDKDNDKRYNRDSFNYNKAPTSSSLRREDLESSYKENVTTKKNIDIPDPDYISVSSLDNLGPPKESKDIKPPVPPKPPIKPREFKGPYGPDDLDDMYNPLTMALRNKNRGRVPFEADDDLN